MADRRDAAKPRYRVLRLRGEPPMTRFLAAQLGTSHYFDITAARRDFGYSPASIDGRGDAAAARPGIRHRRQIGRSVQL